MTQQERIKADAVKLYPFPEQDGFRAAYIAGVTAENERAQVWADALEEIAESNCDYESTSISGKLHKPDCRACRAKEALELWKGEKEPERPCPHCGKERHHISLNIIKIN